MSQPAPVPLVSGRTDDPAQAFGAGRHELDRAVFLRSLAELQGPARTLDLRHCALGLTVKAATGQPADGSWQGGVSWPSY